MRFGRNAECPCGSGSKYKKCCYGRVNWDAIFTHGTVLDAALRMTVRGKNRLFMTKVAEILQLDNLPSPPQWINVKRAMNTRAVREIHEAIALIWPSADDLHRVLREEANQQNALYVGSYQPEAILRGLARHSLYSESILMIDPLLHPNAAADKFNPVMNPASHRSNTLLGLRLLILLSPWIDSGIVRVVRTPGDFDGELFATTLQTSHDRYSSSPDLAAIAEAEASQAVENMQEYKDYYVLIQPDPRIAETARRQNPGITPAEITELLAGVQAMRDRHPFYVDPPLGPNNPDSFISFGSGTNYEMAKIVAGETNAHLITDMRYRWREIEMDRDTSGIDRQQWSPFAKAMNDVKLRFIDRADLALALRLRKEKRLEDLRLFFRKVWSHVAKGDPFADSLAMDLAAELQLHVREAESEWSKIDMDLVKWFGSEVATAGALAAGNGKILPSMVGVAIAGTFNLVQSVLQRRKLPITHPAAFFLGK